MHPQKIILFLIGFLFSSYSWSQNFVPMKFETDTAVDFFVRGGYEGYFLSDKVQNYFTRYFIKGGTISNEDKIAASSKLDEKNVIGAEQNMSLQVFDFTFQPFKEKEWGFLIQAGASLSVSSRFNKSLFDLVFFGNRDYAGQTLSLSEFELTQYTYQKLGAGIFSKKDLSYIVVSLVKGQEFQEFNLSQGDFYTDPGGALISFDYNASVTKSDTAKKGFNAFNGIGVCTDMVFNFKIGRDTILPAITNFQLRLEDMGFIKWNSNTLNYEKDSNIVYSGFEVNNFFDPGESFLSGETDINDTVQIRYKQSSYNTLLPATFTFGNVVDPFRGKWIKPLFGFRYKLFANYSPMGYLGVNARFHKYMFGNLTAVYGGYGGFRTGFQFTYQKAKHLHITAGSSNVVGWVSKNGYGKDVFVNLGYIF